MTTVFGEIPFPEIFWPGVATVFGLLIGSFLNVCIHRLPKEESVITPRSHCPACGHMITWHENIPLLSYLALRGRCSKCGIRISPQYFLVELTNGLLYCCLAVLFGPGLELMKYAIFASIMLALVIIDFKDRVLPDELTLAGVLLGAAFSLVVPLSDGVAAWLTHPLGPWPPALLSFFDSLLGMTLGAGVLWLVREAYYQWRRVEGMGFGDLKLMAAIGAFIGPELTLLTIFLGSMAGAVLGGVFILIYRNRDTQYELPFGSFLGAMALVTALWGKGVVQWYLALF